MNMIEGVNTFDIKVQANMVVHWKSLCPFSRTNEYKGMVDLIF
jgi:hypothetical protein